LPSFSGETKLTTAAKTTFPLIISTDAVGILRFKFVLQQITEHYRTDQTAHSTLGASNRTFKTAKYVCAPRTFNSPNISTVIIKHTSS